MRIIKVPSENEYKKLKEEDDCDPIQSFDDVNLDDINERYRELVRKRFIEYWNKYDVEGNNFILKEQYFPFMREINQSFRLNVEERRYQEEYDRADKRKLGSVFKHNILFLIYKTADRLQVIFETQ